MFVQNCNLCRHHSLQKRSYSYMHMAPARRPFDSISCDLVGLFHSPSSRGNSYKLVCMCLLTNYPIAIPIPDKHTESHASVPQTHICYLWWVTNHDNR